MCVDLRKCLSTIYLCSVSNIHVPPKPCLSDEEKSYNSHFVKKVETSHVTTHTDPKLLGFFFFLSGRTVEEQKKNNKKPKTTKTNDENILVK